MVSIRKRSNFFLADCADRYLAMPSELNDSQRARRDVVVRALVVLIAVTIVLLLFGVLMVFSATSARSIGAVIGDSSGTVFFLTATRHAIWVGISLVIGLAIVVMPYQWIERFSYWLLAGAIFLQILVLFIGETINGNKNWLSLGSAVQVQPSEFLKVAMIVWLAHALARLTEAEIRSLHTIVIPSIGFIASTAVVLAGRDMGTGLVYVLIGVGMFWCAGLKNSMIVCLGILGAFGAAILVAAQPSRFRRVTDFFFSFLALPDIDEPTQAEFAQFAFGSGGISGVGLGAGKEKWRDLAEAHTDFIYAVIGEELGLFGTLAVILLFIMLGWSYVQLAVNMNTRYGQLVVVGVGIWICGQALANMCVVTGLLPVFGVPLPFLSQGGSSMLGVLAGNAVVIGCAFGVPGVKDAFSLKNRMWLRSRAIVKG